MNLNLLYPGTGQETLLWPGISMAEKVLRPLAVYLFLWLAFRFTRKRELSQSTLFDFLIILLISNVVQNAIIGEDKSLAGAFVGVFTLLALSWGLDKIASQSKDARKILEGGPVLLIYEGQIVEAGMEKESVDMNDLQTTLRKQGIACLSEVRYAVLELDGQISVIKADAAQPANQEDCVMQEILRQAPDTQKQ